MQTRSAEGDGQAFIAAQTLVMRLSRCVCACVYACVRARVIQLEQRSGGAGDVRVVVQARRCVCECMHV